MDPSLKNHVGGDRDRQFLEASHQTFERFCLESGDDSMKLADGFDQEIKLINSSENSEISVIENLGVVSAENKYKHISNQLSNISNKLVKINQDNPSKQVKQFIDIFGGVEGLMDEIEKTFDYNINDLRVRYISTRGPKTAMYKQVQVDYVSNIKRELVKDVNMLANNIASMMNVMRLQHDFEIMTVLKRINAFEERLKGMVWENEVDREKFLVAEKVHKKRKMFVVRKLDPSLRVWNDKLACSLANKVALGRNSMGVYGYELEDKNRIKTENLNKIYSKHDQSTDLLNYIQESGKPVSSRFYGLIVQKSNLEWHKNFEESLRKLDDKRYILVDEAYLNYCINNVKNAISKTVRLPLAHGRIKMILKNLDNHGTVEGIRLSAKFWKGLVTTVKDLEVHTANLDEKEYSTFLKEQDVIMKKILSLSKRIPLSK